MDQQVFNIMVNNTAKFNPRVANGFVVEEVDKAPEYIRKIVESAQNDFPEGLKFIDMVTVSPEEEYGVLVRNGTYQISRSNIYAVKLLFEYNGEPLRPQYLFLPYLDAGGTLMLSGSTFTVTPVLIDKAYSVGPDSIFLYVNRSKLTFRQLAHNYYENGKKVSAYLVYSDLYGGRNPLKLKTDQLRPTHKMELAVVHYLLAREGVSGMFKKYTKTDVFIGDSNTVNANAYPPEEWTICKSIGVRPSKLRVNNYVASDICIAIRNCDLTPVSRSMIASIFYVIDFYPHRAKAEYIDDAQLWYLLLALTIKPDTKQEAVCLDKLNDHFASLETWVDEQVRRTLADCDVDVNDIWDILIDVVKTYPNRSNISTEQLSTMYGKRLVILRYLLSNVRDSIFRMGFDLQSLVNSRKPYTKKDIETIMMRRLKPLTIMRVNSKHPEVSSVGNPTDNKVPIMTLPIKLQSSMALQNRSAISKFPPSNVLNASIAEVGNLTSDAGDDYTGRSRLNPYVTLDEDGTVIQNPITSAIIEKTQANIRHD